MWQHLSPPMQGGRVRSRRACGSTRALLSREAGSEPVGHMAALKPFRVGRSGSEPWYTWQRQSPLEQGGGDQSHETHSNM
jgi:hypothetical protein